jgi:hypothetical protein
VAVGELVGHPKLSRTWGHTGIFIRSAGDSQQTFANCCPHAHDVPVSATPTPEREQVAAEVRALMGRGRGHRRVSQARLATDLLTAGVDVRTVAGRLGHANAATTLKVYAQWSPQRDADAATILGARLDDEPDDKAS